MVTLCSTGMFILIFLYTSIRNAEYKIFKMNKGNNKITELRKHYIVSLERYKNAQKDDVLLPLLTLQIITV